MGLEFPLERRLALWWSERRKRRRMGLDGPPPAPEIVPERELRELSRLDMMNKNQRGTEITFREVP